MKDIYDTDLNRLVIAKNVNDICKQLVNGENVKGMYIHGPFGTGKSFILGAIANQLKAKVLFLRLFIYLNIFTLKSGFRDGSYETKLTNKRANILMIDDIGAEEVTPC